MQKDKVEIIKKIIESPCYVCNGLGYDSERDIKLMSPEKSKCETCNGTGIYKETFYYHCVNGICISGDTLK